MKPDRDTPRYRLTPRGFRSLLIGALVLMVLSASLAYFFSPHVRVSSRLALYDYLNGGSYRDAHPFAAVGLIQYPDEIRPFMEITWKLGFEQPNSDRTLWFFRMWDELRIQMLPADHWENISQDQIDRAVEEFLQEKAASSEPDERRVALGLLTPVEQIIAQPHEIDGYQEADAPVSSPENPDP